MPVLVRFVFLTRVSHLWFPADPAGAHAGHPCCALGFGPTPPMSLGLDWFCKAKKECPRSENGHGGVGFDTAPSLCHPDALWKCPSAQPREPPRDDACRKEKCAR